MSFIYSLLIGIAVNLDNFLIGVNLGARRERLSAKNNLLISLISGLCALLAACCAKQLSAGPISYAKFLGCAVMILFAAYSLLDIFRGGGQNAARPPKTRREALLLGAALALNCIPPAFGAGLLGLSPWGVGLLCAFFSYLCLSLGNRLGRQTKSGQAARLLGLLSALLLLFTGLGEFLFS